MQQLLINELDKLEDLAWSTFKLERTPEQMEAMQDAIDLWLGAVIRKDWDSVRTFEIHITAFFAIGLCRRNLEECKDPAESLALLVQTAVALGRTKMLLEVGESPLGQPPTRCCACCDSRNLESSQVRYSAYWWSCAT